MSKISKPKTMDEKMSMLLTIPSVENDMRIKIVEMMKPEFRMTFWKLSL
jgi:hypothetical protein